ncbi:MAG: hypothetical protein U9R14_04740 [Patescibacteria group bacterium]|nr:hypothetical protein [Patescibacteria group bacterium]
MKIKIKNDRYYKKRNGAAKIINIQCAKCGNFLFSYQKDGHGELMRCYLNRIIKPEKYSRIKNEANNIKDMDNLKCVCGEIIGVPMQHKDKRLAFRMKKGKFKRKYKK